MVPPGWKVAVGLLAAVLLVVGVGLLIARAAGFGKVRDAIAEADSRWFFLCFFAQILALAGYAAVVREAFRCGNAANPGFRLSAHVMLASIGASRVFASGGAAAIAATYWCFRRARFSRREALVRVLGFNALFYVVFAAGVWTAALLVLLGIWGDAPLAVTIPWLVVVPFCAVAASFITQPARVEWSRPSGSIVRRGLAVAIAGTAWVREVIPHRAGYRALVASGLYWTANVVCLWAALNSVGQALPLPELILAFATGHVAMVLPLPLGGVGGVDAAMTYALTTVGVALAPALVAVAIYRLFAFWMPTLPALVALAFLPRAGRRLEHAAASPSE